MIGLGSDKKNRKNQDIWPTVGGLRLCLFYVFLAQEHCKKPFILVYLKMGNKWDWKVTPFPPTTFTIRIILDPQNKLSHVLVHFVKSECLYSVNPFSAFFSSNNRHNCPILFCICPKYLPAGLALRFSFQKHIHLHFQGK